jgi:hypothetical protein
MRAIKQSEAVNHIQRLLEERGLQIAWHHLEESPWVVFARLGRQIGVDPASGVWIRDSEAGDWRCLASPCTVSGAIQAVEFLANGQPCP